MHATALDANAARMTKIELELIKWSHVAVTLRDAIAVVDGNLREHAEAAGRTNDEVKEMAEAVTKLGAHLVQHDVGIHNVHQGIEQMKNDLNNTAGRTLAEHMAKLEEVSNFGLSADAAFKQLAAKVFVLEVKTHETVSNLQKLARAQEGAASVAPPPTAELVGNCRWGNNRTATTVPSGYMSSAYAGSAAEPSGCGDKTC